MCELQLPKVFDISACALPMPKRSAAAHHFAVAPTDMAGQSLTLIHVHLQSSRT
jgi:hypothetical protein